MTGIGNEVQLWFRPGSMEIPGARKRTDNIVPTLNNDGGDRSDPADIFDQIIVGTEEGVVHEVVTFDPGEGEGKLRIGKLLDHGRVEEKPGGTAFPDTPRACRLQTNRLVIARQPAVISAHQIRAFILRNDP